MGKKIDSFLKAATPEGSGHFRHEGRPDGGTVRPFDAVDQVGQHPADERHELEAVAEQAEPTTIGPRRSTRNRSSGVVVYRQVVPAMGSGRTRDHPST